MFFAKSKEVSKLPFISKDSKGDPKDFVVIDQFSGQEFSINKFGWPSSDVSVLLNSDKYQLIERITSRLTLLRGTGFKNKSDKQLLQELVPRCVQSYGELSYYLDWYKNKYGEPLFEPDRYDSEHDDTPVVDHPENTPTNTN